MRGFKSQLVTFRPGEALGRKSLTELVSKSCFCDCRGHEAVPHAASPYRTDLVRMAPGTGWTKIRGTAIRVLPKPDWPGQSHDFEGYCISLSAVDARHIACFKMIDMSSWRLEAGGIPSPGSAINNPHGITTLEEDQLPTTRKYLGQQRRLGLCHQQSSGKTSRWTPRWWPG